MRTNISIILCLLLGPVAPSGLRAQTPPRGLTLAAALAAAEERSPELAAGAAAVEEARGRLLAARTYPHNPELEVGGADRSGQGSSSTDREIRLSQEVEIAGQRGKRIDAARAALAAAEARYDRRRREVRAGVETAFASTVQAGALREVAHSDLTVTRNLLAFEERRLDKGAGTQIQVNLARAAAGRAVRRFQEATALWNEGRARLAEALGLDPATPPTVIGSLPVAPPAELPSLEELTRRALDRRSDLAALRHDLVRSERQVTLERSLAVPNVVVGAFAAHEEGDEITGIGAGIGIPLFDRNRGGIAEARAATGRAAANVRSGELRVGRQVATAYAHYRAAAEALTALQSLVVGTLEESLNLLQKAVEAGELSATDVLLLRRELVDARREQIEAAGELWLARTDLELAVETDLPAARREEATDEE